MRIKLKFLEGYRRNMGWEKENNSYIWAFFVAQSTKISGLMGQSILV
jgi:hypothetical protein